MIRKQFFIDEAQNRQLKILATATGRSEGELIREGIEQRLAAAKSDAGAEDWKSAWRQAAGIWADYHELDSILAERRKMRGQRRQRMNRQMADGRKR